MSVIHFDVLGTATPQGSKKAYVRGGRAILVEERKAGIDLWRGSVVRAACQALQGRQGFTGPVAVDVEFRFTRPKGHWRTGRNAHLLRDGADPYPPTKDIDKLQRSTFDAITTARVWRDDALVVDVHARKVWADHGRPGATIAIRDATPVTHDGQHPECFDCGSATCPECKQGKRCYGPPCVNARRDS